jgi:hypothetical protein
METEIESAAMFGSPIFFARSVQRVSGQRRVHRSASTADVARSSSAQPLRRPAPTYGIRAQVHVLQWFYQSATRAIEKEAHDSTTQTIGGEEDGRKCKIFKRRPRECITLADAYPVELCGVGHVDEM